MRYIGVLQAQGKEEGSGRAGGGDFVGVPDSISSIFCFVFKCAHSFPSEVIALGAGDQEASIQAGKQVSSKFMC